MIKWGEFHEGDVLYEAFLPEHEQEPCEWLVRASCRGHILGERHLSLTWPPKFGPDVDDVAAVEAMAGTLITELANAPVPDGAGAYVPATIDLPPTEPILHAMLYAVIEQYAQAEASIGLSEEQSAAYLGLPVRAAARGLFPFAVTSARDDRMHRLIALDHVLKNHANLRAVKSELLSAVLDSDISRLRALLKAAGVDPTSDHVSTGSDT